MEPAPAKLNLFLHVTGKRPDGYHLLESLVVFTEFCDVVRAAPANDMQIEITGPFATNLQQENNLVLKAAQRLQQKFSVTQGAHIRLEKHIPISAGLGGGSADAAATLRVLTRLWKLDAQDPRIIEVAQELGADVPACLWSSTCLMKGIGEQLTAVDSDQTMWLLLVNPRVPVSTQHVFETLQAPYTPAIPEGEIPYIKSCRNDLQAPALQLCPEIQTILDVLSQLHGCTLARMSGSGATCFGWFENEDGIREAAAILSTHYPDWWVQPTRTLP